jgi:tRNA (guanine-N1)-methyltransferase
MNIYFITPFPELVETLIRNNISNQGINQNLVNIEIINLRDFSNNKHKQIDDEPYGGGSGMVMMCLLFEISLRLIISILTRFLFIPWFEILFLIRVSTNSGNGVIK